MSNFLDKRKIAGIEKRADGVVNQNASWTGNIVTVAIVVSFAISTTHLFSALRGGGLLGLFMGILTSLATEGSFLHHRYITFPRHENTTQKWSALVGMGFAIGGSLLFISADLMLLMGRLDVAAFLPIAIGGMLTVMFSAILSESIYNMASLAAEFARQKYSDALAILRSAQETRVDLDNADFEIMKALGESAVAESLAKAQRIRDAIDARVSRVTGEAVPLLTAEELRDGLLTPSPTGQAAPVRIERSPVTAPSPIVGGGNHTSPKSTAG